MRCVLASLCVALGSLVASVSAFSSGYLLPDYVCHPSAPSGFGPNPAQPLPTSLATYLPFVQRPSSNPLYPFAANQGAAPNNNGFGTPFTNVQGTQFILANIHNQNRTAGCEHVVLVNVTAVSAVTATANTLNYTPLNVPVNTVVPGQLHVVTAYVNAHDFNAPANPLAGQSLCDVGWGVVTATDIANLAIDGLGMFAVDATGHRVGQFTHMGFSVTQNAFFSGVPVTMTTVTQAQLQYWPACGPWGVGIIHNQIICQNNLGQTSNPTINGAAFAGMAGQYTGIIWAAPGHLQSGTQLTITGPGVTDGGFGKHTTAFNVATLPASGVGLAVAMPIVTYVTWLGANLMVFFDPQTMAGVNPQVIAGSYTVAIQSSATNPTTQTSVNAASSPASIPYTTLANAGFGLGTTVFVVVTANPVAGSTTGAQIAAASIAYPFALPLTQPTATVTLAQAASVCNATYLYDTTFFNMYQNDNQCSFQTSLFATGTITGVKGAAAPIASVSVATTFITVAVVVAAIFTFTKRD